MLAGPPRQGGQPARVPGVGGDDLHGLRIGSLPRAVGDAARARHESDGVAERDKLGRGGAADAAGAEDEVVSHGLSFHISESMLSFQYGAFCGTNQEQCSHLSRFCGRLAAWEYRQERRAAIEADIIRVAREHLAKYGAPGLSLRSVAKELGMVSSGIYRYVASRDDLLTRLIVRAYMSLADTASAAHSAVQCRRP